MSATTLNFIKAGILYLVIGVTMGAVFAVRPSLGSELRTVHAHLNLLGWVSMMICGVAYHILPRFRGRQLYSERLATLHFWLMNIGLLGFSIFLSLYVYLGGDTLRTVVAVFGAIEAVSLYLFAYNMFRTL